MNPCALLSLRHVVAGNCARLMKWRPDVSPLAPLQGCLEGDKVPSVIPQSVPSAPTELPQINLSWLLRLRSFSLLGQATTILVVQFVLGLTLTLGALGILLLLSLLTIATTVVWIKRGTRIPSSLPFLLMIYDVLHLTALLYLTGGPFNPFGITYLVLIALGTVVLGERQVWALAGLAAICSALLFVAHRPLILPGGHAEHMRTHLYGMWVAFLIAACFIVYFLVRTRRALDDRERALRTAQERTAQKDKLASLATLAAGAAHELSTPLSTIALVAEELLRQQSSAPLSVREDLALIQSEVRRCRMVLDQMASDAGQSAGESLTRISLRELLDQAVTGLPPLPEVKISVEKSGAQYPLPVRALSQGIRGLIKNAQEAVTTEEGVVVRAYCEGDHLMIEVIDQGIGIPAERLPRIGEPFYSSKEAGMGLGVFLCRSVVESLGGSLELQSSLQQGTRAVIKLPQFQTDCVRVPQPIAAKEAESANRERIVQHPGGR